MPCYKFLVTFEADCDLATAKQMVEDDIGSWEADQSPEDIIIIENIVVEVHK